MPDKCRRRSLETESFTLRILYTYDDRSRLIMRKMQLELRSRSRLYGIKTGASNARKRNALVRVFPPFSFPEVKGLSPMMIASRATTFGKCTGFTSRF